MKKSRKLWSAWRIDDQEVRVQINHPDVARAFAKVNAVRSVGYSVMGKYTRLFHINRPVAWVDGWMKDYIKQQGTKPGLN